MLKQFNNLGFMFESVQRWEVRVLLGAESAESPCILQNYVHSV